MSNIKLAIQFETSHVDNNNKFPLIESRIKDFLTRYFPDIEIKEDILIVLTDNVNVSRRRIDGSENEYGDNAIASTIYLPKKEQFVIVFAIGCFKLDVFPEQASEYSKDFIQSVELTTNHAIYHEMQHIKNKYEFPTLAQIHGNAAISNYFEFLAVKFVDEYLATLKSQSLFRTLTDDLFEDFKKLKQKMDEKILAKSLTRNDMNELTYFYSHVFAINKVKIINNEDDKLISKIENELDSFEKRFFINIGNLIKKSKLGDDDDIRLLVFDITDFFGGFYRLWSNSMNARKN